MYLLDFKFNHKYLHHLNSYQHSINAEKYIQKKIYGMHVPSSINKNDIANPCTYIQPSCIYIHIYISLSAGRTNVPPELGLI